MTEKYVLENGVIKDTTNNITFHDFVDVLILINGQSRHLTELLKENEQLKSEKEHYKKQVDELDVLLNKYEITFEELEEILCNDYRERF